jgi:hypothetical protein
MQVLSGSAVVNGKGALITQADFISPEACDFLMRFYEENIEQLGRADFNPEFSFRTIGFSAIDMRRDEPSRLAKELLNRMRLKLVNLLKNEHALPQVYPELTQIVKWPTGSAQGVHLDDVETFTTYAAIIYLNDDFVGGQTFFPSLGVAFPPKRGTVVAFQGRVLPHGVMRVAEGVRYTLPCWFTAAPEHAEC